MTTPCVQEGNIKDLQTKQHVFMEIMKEVKEDVKDIKEYLYNELPKRYARKDSVNRLWTILWSIIGFFFIAFGTIVVSAIKYFLSLNVK